MTGSMEDTYSMARRLKNGGLHSRSCLEACWILRSVFLHVRDVFGGNPGSCRGMLVTNVAVVSVPGKGLVARAVRIVVI